MEKCLGLFRKKIKKLGYFLLSLVFVVFTELLYSVTTEFRVNKGTVTLNNGADLNISGDITINSSGSLIEGTGTGTEIQLQGKWTNFGNFECGDSTVTFYGTITSTITGNTTFYTLKCETGGKEIYLEAGSTQVIRGTLLIDGSAGNRIVLHSTSTGVRWFIEVLTPQTVSYVDVQDSDALGNDITAENSVNSGNNDDAEPSPHWIFPAYVPPDMMVVYSSGTLNYPWFREIAQGTTYWGIQQSGIPSMNSVIQHIRLKENPVGDERILMAGIYAGTNDYEIWVTTWVDGNWANSSIQLADALPTGAPGMDDCRGFDIAFEDQSGEGLICYTKNTADTLYYRIWSGGTFSVEYSTSGLPTGDTLTPYWIKMTRRPGYDDIALIYLASDGTNHEIGALIWDGANNKFSQQILLESEASSFSKESFDVCALNQSRDFMFVWGSGTVLGVTNLESRRWNGSFGNEVPVGVSGSSLDGVPEFLVLKCNTTDQLMLAITDAGDGVSAIRYNGSNWDSSVNTFDIGARGIDNKYVDLEWEDSDDGNWCILVFGDGADTDWAYWDGTGWTKTSGLWGGADESNRVELMKQPDGNIWLCAYRNDSQDYVVQRWDVTNNVWDSSTTIFNVVDSYTSYYQKFCFSPKTTSASLPPDTTPPAAITTISASTYSLTGKIKLEWEAPGDDNWTGTLGSASDKAQFRIQYATYPTFNWGDYSTYNIAIDTYGVNPYDIQTVYITLDKETTYYFRIWTRDEASAGNWSDISYGATVWCRIAPASISTLSALAELDGDVKLSWIAPGDDGTTGQITDGRWKIKYATYSAVDWNEAGNWSEISNGATTTIVKVIGISVSTNTYDFGEVPVNGSSVSVSGIIVKNTGNVNQDYSLKISSITLYDNSPSLWTSTDTTTGHDRFILYAIFHGTTPASNYFVNKDTVTTVERTSSSEIFTYDGGTTGYEQRGDNVPKGEERTLWFKIDMPVTVTTSKKEKITITITAGESP